MTGPFAGLRVLELGAGCGLSGLALAASRRSCASRLGDLTKHGCCRRRHCRGRCRRLGLRPCAVSLGIPLAGATLVRREALEPAGKNGAATRGKPA